jgi:hypothetical protein
VPTDYAIPLTQEAIKDHEAAYAYCVRLTGAVAAKNSWPKDDLNHCYEQMSELYGDVDDLTSYLGAFWEGGLFGSMAGVDVELAEEWWKRFAVLARSWKDKGLRGANDIEAIATQAYGGVIAAVKAQAKAESPITQVAGAAKGSTEDVADIAAAGGGAIERYPWLPLVIAAGVIGGVVLLLRGGGRTVVVRK